jgi:hypothetical protein
MRESALVPVCHLRLRPQFPTEMARYLQTPRWIALPNRGCLHLQNGAAQLRACSQIHCALSRMNS